MEIKTEDRWHVVKRAVKRAGTGAMAIALAGALVFGVTGCSQTSSASSASSVAASAAAAESSGQDSLGSEEAGESAGSETVAIDESLYDLEYSDRDKDASYDESQAVKVNLTGDTAKAESGNVDVDGSTVTITAEGVYVLSGTLDDGQIVVNAPEDAKVQLVLDGASITNKDGSAIYVQQADKCFVTLADGSNNVVADGEKYEFEGDATEPDAAIYSTCDLTLQGSGTLKVIGSYNDAVKTKDDLVITGGTYEITAKGDGLVGKDSVKVADGTISVKTSEGDGIKSSKDDDDSKGFVSIDGGSVTIDAADKGIKAEKYLRIAGGTVEVTAGDDAIHSNGCASVHDGAVTLTSGDDALHVEYTLDVNGGTVDVKKCVEGFEGQVININGGESNIVSSDDAVNASTPDASKSTGSQATKQDGSASGEDASGGGSSSGSADSAQGSASDGASSQDSAQGSASDGGSSSGSADSANHRGKGRSDRSEFSKEGFKSGEAPQPPEGFSGGSDMPEPPEGFSDGDMPEPPDGFSFDAAPSDGADGSGDSRGGGFPGGFPGGGMMGETDESCSINMNGGKLVIVAEGDAIDSNGYFNMNGGEVYISGPTSNGNGSIDFGLGAKVTGGTLIAAGSSGMAESFTEGTQGFALVQASGSAGDTITVTDSSGKELASYTAEKDFQCVVVTAEGMESGQTYKLTVGDQTTEFEATTEGSAGGFGGFGGFGGKGDRGDWDGKMPGRGDGESSENAMSNTSTTQA